jgi:predicted phosphodiesterase
MPKLIWLSDLHLDSASAPTFEFLLSDLARERADVVLLGGDTADAATLIACLEDMLDALDSAICMVLGNHDFYNGSIGEVRDLVAEFSKRHDRLTFLEASGPVEVAEGVVLVGHGCWGDGRYGDYANSGVELSDFLEIEDLKGLDKASRLERLNALGDAAALSLGSDLEAALAEYRRVICLTHVPPFREACWHQGQLSNDDYLPHFACKAAGDVLLDAMRRHPQAGLTVLCGHTHSPGFARVAPNIAVHTGRAEYGRPEVQRIFSPDELFWSQSA